MMMMMTAFMYRHGMAWHEKWLCKQASKLSLFNPACMLYLGTLEYGVDSITMLAV